MHLTLGEIEIEIEIEIAIDIDVNMNRPDEYAGVRRGLWYFLGLWIIAGGCGSGVDGDGADNDDGDGGDLLNLGTSHMGSQIRKSA